MIFMREEKMDMVYFFVKMSGGERLVRGIILEFVINEVCVVFIVIEKIIMKYMMNVVSMVYKVFLGIILFGLCRFLDMDVFVKMLEVVL